MNHTWITACNPTNSIPFYRWVATCSNCQRHHERNWVNDLNEILASDMTKCQSTQFLLTKFLMATL